MIPSLQSGWGILRRLRNAGRVGRYRFHVLMSFLRKKPLFAISVALFLAGTIGMGYQHYLGETVPLPGKGGAYVEGIVGNKNNLDDLIARLTSVGLVLMTSERQIVPVLAKEWSISQDGKTYTFVLLSGVDGNEVVTTLKDEELFKTVEFQLTDSQTVVAKLKQPFGPFLSLLALPLFPYGPYQIAEEGDNQVVFIANPSFVLGEPYLEKITVRMYPDEQSLRRAISQREVSGAVTTESVAGWQRFETTIPRSIILMLNTDRSVLRDMTARTRLFGTEQFSEQLQLTLVTTPQLRSYADPVIEKWTAQNVNITLKLIEDATIRDSVIPKRDYDVLIYGVDYGIEPDPFRFWHSLQATETGLNLAQLKDTTLDAMLEEARQIVDDAQRFARYGEIEKKIDELAVRDILKEMTVTYQVSPKIKGVEQPFMVNAASRYNLVWRWYTNERRELKN